MPDDNTVYSTKQVADSLGLGSAMVRKYAVALEKLTGKDIPLKRRDGRQFAHEHYTIIAQAKSLVDSNNGLSVETALRMALGTAEIGANALTPPGAYGNSSEIAEAITAAIRAGNAELLAEVRGLRQDMRQLSSTAESDTTIDKTRAGEKQDDAHRHGLIVRAAFWLESLLRR